MTDWLDQLNPDQRSDWARFVDSFRRDSLEKIELVAACKQSGTACFVKQLGSRPIARHPYISGVADSFSAVTVTGAGREPDEWPADLRVREFPHALASEALA